MKNTRVGSGTMLVEPNTYRRQKLGAILNSDPTSLYTQNQDDDNDLSNQRHSNASAATPTGSSSNNTSPLMMSPWNQVTSSPYNKSPWSLTSSSINFFNHYDDNHLENGLIGSLVREEGHIYSLAVSGDLLYTGSDSKNIRVWKHMKDYTGFKSSSGLVKTIVISGEKIFTGHQDGKIRVWKGSHKNPSSYKRVGSLPKFKDYVKSSMNPKKYVEVRPNRNAVKVKHFDAVSSLSLDEEEGLLYSGSWDKTLKVWRVSDSKCVESIQAHDDAVNTVVSASGGYVLTGSADGTVKMWKREPKGKKTKHELDRIVLKQENAVTSLAVNRLSTVVYCGSSDGLVNYWDRDLKNNGINHGGVLKGHKLAVLCLAAAGRLVFSGSADKNVFVWKREESGAHSCLSVLTGHMGPVKCIAVKEEPDEGVRPWTVYTGSLDKSVKVWRVNEHVAELKMIQDSGPTYDSSPRGSNYSSPAKHANRNTSSSFNSRTSTESLDSPVPGFSYSSPKKHSNWVTNSNTNSSYSLPIEHALSHGGASFDSSAPQLSYSPPKTHTNFVGNNGKSNNPNGSRKPEHATSHGGASYGSSDPGSSTAHTNGVSNNGSNTGNSISSRKAEHAPSHGGASNSYSTSGLSYSSHTTQPHSVRTIGKSNLSSITNNGKSEHAPSHGGASYDTTVVAGGIGKVNLTPNNSNFNIKMSEEVASRGGASYDSPITGVLSRYSPSTNTISVSNGSSNTTSNTNSNKGLKSPVPNSSNSWQNLSSKYGNGEEKRTGDFDARSNNHLQSNGDQNRRRL